MNRSWILFGVLGAAASFGACTGTIGGGSPTDEPENVDEIADSLCVVDTSIRRLTRTEYNNTVRDLLGDTTGPADALPPEEEVGGFDNQAAALTTSDLLIEQFMKVAEDVSARAIQNLDTLQPDCDPTVDGETTCADQFIESWGMRAFRRPLTDEEKGRLRGLFDWAMADADLGTYADGIELVIQEVLQSPHFLYRPEFGSEKAIEGDVVPFTSWEMATKLSYMLWNTMPDDELFEAAEADALTDKASIEAQARRMLDDPRAKDAIRNFHKQWLLLTHIDSVSKDAATFPEYDESIRPLWKEEIQRLVEYVILEGDGKLTTLLTADFSFMNEELAAFYGEDVLDAPTGTEMVQVSLDPSRRAGILTSAAVMATHASASRTSPVFRGKFIREQLMCDSIPPPPADLEIIPPENDPELTTKEQFEEIGNNPTCAPCHNLMNPIGFAFEHYDALGLWRDQQNGKDIDAVADVIQTDDLDGSYDGALELAAAMAESAQVSECVSSQWFRFAYNRTVTENDSCTTDALNEAFVASGYDIKELLVTLTQTNAFLYRRRVQPAAGEAEGGDQ
jgi:hypothetical protein